MNINEDNLREFMKAYKEEFGEELSLKDGRKMFARLVRLYQLIYSPLPWEKGYRKKHP